MAKSKDDEPKFFPGSGEECKDNILVDCCGSGVTMAGEIIQSLDMVREVVQDLQTLYAAYQAFTTATTVMQGLQMMMAGIMTTTFVVGLVIYVVMQVLMWLITCNITDIEASTKKELKVCVRVGRYCSVSALICIEHMTAHCCFSTVLARIIQEQARAQLGISWGSPDNPNCRGLTATELQTVDWNAIDLSEYLADLTHRMKWPDQLRTEANETRVTNDDHTGDATRSVINAGSLGKRVQSAIAPPGGWNTTSPSNATLSITVFGSGIVSVSPGSSTSCPGGTCQFSVPSNRLLTITATPLNGSAFESWSGLCTGAVACTATLAPGATETLTATFTTTSNFLSIAIAGQGTVTVTTNTEGVPASQTCSVPSCTFSFPPASDVTLTATSTSSAFTFVSWGAACTGTTPCTLRLTTSQSVIARFGGTPIINSLVDDVSFPVPAGTTMTWTASTTGGVQPIQYRYIRVDGTTEVLVQDWSTLPSYTWVTTPAHIGTHSLKLLVRNSGSLAEFEDYRQTPSFTIMPAVQVVSASPSSGPRGTLNMTITLNGNGFRLGDLVFFTQAAATIPGLIVSAVSTPSPTQLMFNLKIDPATPLGLADINVADPDGTSATGLGLFTITP